MAAGSVGDLGALDRRDPRRSPSSATAEIVPREAYDSTPAAGDRLEIVHFVQGG
ncbi:MAG: sulfur carrier protein ThiS [Thermoanaerobaculia bacterium]